MYFFHQRSKMVFPLLAQNLILPFLFIFTSLSRKINYLTWIAPSAKIIIILFIKGRNKKFKNVGNANAKCTRGNAFKNVGYRSIKQKNLFQYSNLLFQVVCGQTISCTGNDKVIHKCSFKYDTDK